MGVYSPAAIRRAIREVLDGTLQGLAAVSVGVFSPGSFEGQPLEALKTALRQTENARHRFDVRLREKRSHSATPTSAFTSNAIELQEIVVYVYTSTKTSIELDERDDALQQVSSDCSTAVDALRFPGVLSRTSDDTATGIVSGMMLGPGGVGRPQWNLISEDWDNLIIRSQITGSVIIDSTSADLGDAPIFQPGEEQLPFGAQVIDVYLNFDTGNDNNTGTDRAHPLKDFPRVDEILPVAFGVVVIHAAYPTTGSYTMPRWRARLCRRFIIWGDWDWDPSTETVVASGTLASGTTPYALKTSETFAADALAGNFIILDTGAAAGTRRQLQNHTTDTFPLNFPVNVGVGAGGGGAPAAGDRYRVVRPTTRINMRAECDRLMLQDRHRRVTAYDWFTDIGSIGGEGHDLDQGVVMLVNVALEFPAGDPGGHCFPTVARANMVAYGVEVSTSSNNGSANSLAFTQARFMMGCDHPSGGASELERAYPFGLDDADNGAVKWTGYGVHFIHQGTDTLACDVEHGGVVGYWVFSTLHAASGALGRIGCSETARIDWAGGAMYDSYLFCSGGFRSYSLGDADVCRPRMQNPNVPACIVFDSSSVRAQMQQLEFVNCASPLVVGLNGARIQLYAGSAFDAAGVTGVSTGGRTLAVDTRADGAETFGTLVVFAGDPNLSGHEFGSGSVDDFDIGVTNKFRRTDFAVDGSLKLNACGGGIVRNEATVLPEA